MIPLLSEPEDVDCEMYALEDVAKMMFPPDQILPARPIPPANVADADKTEVASVVEVDEKFITEREPGNET
jgi:hypothetical protein